jgi:hypothetical protein
MVDIEATIDILIRFDYFLKFIFFVLNTNNMLLQAIQTKYVEYNDLRDKVISMREACPAEMNKALRDMLIALVVLVMFFMVLFLVAIYFAFKCSIVRKWPILYSVLLILGMLMPNIGGFVIVGMVVYGSLMCGSICDLPADLRRSY